MHYAVGFRLKLEVKVQGTGKGLKINGRGGGRGVGGFEYYTIFMDVLCVLSLMLGSKIILNIYFIFEYLAKFLKSFLKDISLFLKQGICVCPICNTQ